MPNRVCVLIYYDRRKYNTLSKATLKSTKATATVRPSSTDLQLIENFATRNTSNATLNYYEASVQSICLHCCHNVHNLFYYLFGFSFLPIQKGISYNPDPSPIRFSQIEPFSYYMQQGYGYRTYFLLDQRCRSKQMFVPNGGYYVF